MLTREEPLTKRERAELESYVAWTTAVGRAILFLLAVAGVSVLAWRVQSWFNVTRPWWLVPTAIVSALLFRRAARWTGGRTLRALIRQDLLSNAALVHSVRVSEAIACHEVEDEGPTFFLKLDTGETLALAGQYLARHVSRGFPWADFEIRETPHAHRFLGIKKVGAPIRPSFVRPQLSVEEFKAWGLLEHPWRLLQVDFERLRSEQPGT